MKYLDSQHGGKIHRYLRTTPAMDKIFHDAIEEDQKVQDRKYFWHGTCRAYSDEWFDTAKKVLQS